MGSGASNTALRDCPFQEGICKATKCMLWITSRKEENVYEWGHCAIVKIAQQRPAVEIRRRGLMD